VDEAGDLAVAITLLDLLLEFAYHEHLLEKAPRLGRLRGDNVIELCHGVRLDILGVSICLRAGRSDW
jgi:hypothetical protein